MKNVILYTNSLDNAIDEIKHHGGRVVQQFTAQLISAAVPDDFDPAALAYSKDKLGENSTPLTTVAFKAWESNLLKRADLAPNKKEGLSWDENGYDSPLWPVQHSIQDRGVSNSPNTPTSLYMVGKISVGIIIVSGPGHLAFSSDEVANLISQVQNGLQFLATQEARAKITFVYDIKEVAVNVAPGSTSDYETAEAPWRNEALGSMGYSKSRNGSIDYVNDLRNRMKTEWSYVAYFTKYPLRHFAYAIGEKLVMSYFNDGWGPSEIARVFAHETCHIFGAADEYSGCSCAGQYGHLGVPNNNCRSCATAFVPCLMEANTYALCTWTRKQIGWDESLFPTAL